jgi:hypothetical protein
LRKRDVAPLSNRFTLPVYDSLPNHNLAATDISKISRKGYVLVAVVSRESGLTRIAI